MPTTVTIRPKTFAQAQILVPAPASEPFSPYGTEPLYADDASSGNYVKLSKYFFSENQYSKTALCNFYEDVVSSIPQNRVVFSIVAKIKIATPYMAGKVFMGVGAYDGSTFTQMSDIESDYVQPVATGYTVYQKTLSLNSEITTSDLLSSNFRGVFYYTNGTRTGTVNIYFDYFWLDVTFADGQINNYAESLYMHPC